jgi:hypothetical protein
VLIFSILFNNSFASPKTIILIRHADKLKQHDPGSTLSAKGHIRAINFAFYFINTFGYVDYIFASDPKETKSIRPVQTVAPLANILTEHYKRETKILHQYPSKDYKKLADDLLTRKEYDNKTVLICWAHDSMPAFANKLGVKGNLPEWLSDDYDSVYVLNYNDKHELANFTTLHHQYPVDDIYWEDLYKKLV